MTAEILTPVPGGRRGVDDRPRRHLHLVPPPPDASAPPSRRPRDDSDESLPARPPTPLLAPVVAPGTPWAEALPAYAREPSWQLAVAPAWLVLLGPVLVATSAPAVTVAALTLAALTLVVLALALARDLADLWAVGVATGWRRTRRMLRHAVTLGPWGYLGVRGKRTGDWAPFVAATIVWLLTLLTTGSALLAGAASG